MLKTAPLYRRYGSNVNRPDRSGRAALPAIAFSFLGGLLAAGTGCASARPVGVDSATSYLIAVRYDVEPVFAGEGRQEAIETIRGDFRKVAELGFDGVVLRHVDDRDGPMLLNMAGASGLKAALPRRDFAHFGATGTLPGGIGDPGGLLERVPDEVIAHAALAAFMIDPGPSEQTAERGRRLLAALDRQGARCVSPGGDGGLAVIDAGVGDADLEGSATERWLAQYHEALAAGRTAGIVVERYRRPPGDPPGLAADLGPLPPARAAALRELITRARRWGRRLHQATARPVAASVPVDSDLTVAGLSRGEQRYVFVFNASADQFARGTVLLPEAIGGAAAGRAVEVPPSASRSAGRFVNARKGRISLPVALRPGDAVLFELF